MRKWKLVPVEPTPEMLRDGAAAVRDFYSENGEYPRSRAMHKAMLSAAPDPLEDAELVERVAIWLRSRFQCAELVMVDWKKEAKALLKAIHEGNE